MSNYKQQSLFEDDRRRTRRSFKRVRRTRSEGIEVYMRALQDIQMRMKRGEKINFKMVCRFFRIGNLSSKLLPKDLATADITLDYTAKWYNEYFRLTTSQAIGQAATANLPQISRWMTSKSNRQPMANQWPTL